ncbi:MAG: hypothetical protein AAB768_00195 [Patescibacteria group bacterium]
MKTEISQHESLTVVTLIPENQKDKEVISWLRKVLVLARWFKKISNTPDNSLIPIISSENLVFGFDRDLPNFDSL